MPAWRARAHHLTRSRAFLGKSAALILGISMLVAILLHLSRQHDVVRAAHGAGLNQGMPFMTAVREGAKRLGALPDPDPSKLIAWIRNSAALWPRVGVADRSKFDAVALRFGGVEIRPLIAKHTTSEAQGDAVVSYVRFLFLPDGEARASALHELHQAASASPPPLANEMLGDAFLVSGRVDEALQAYLRDLATPDARHARMRAIDLARRQGDAETLKHLCSDDRVRSEIEPSTLWHVAKVTGDRWLLFRGLWGTQWARWMQAAAVSLALLGAAIWYVILIHTGSRERLRWWRYLAAVFAGIASVWLVHWWQGTLEYGGDPENAPSMTHELLQWIMHVGLPEESAKLILFAFFLPVLLHHRSGVKAALTAGCVGLGFALDENLHYFEGSRSMAAIGRLLTANFVHVSLTGIVGWHLYELFRSRFHHATEFLTAFCAVVAAHGIYDFSSGGSASYWGMDIAGMILLALSAKIYLPMLHESRSSHPGGHHITRTSVFILGTALLSGLLMIVTVWDRGSLDGITLVLQELIGLALVGLIYIREWRELD